MPRIERTDIGDYVYHVINRANARVQIFDSDKDYELFENILEEAVEKFDMRLLAYCIMPNHWHLVLYPRNDGDLSLFMGWLTNTHTRRWHTGKGTIGQGHLYQGRYKSFLCQDDSHFLSLVRYVERNAKRANLVKKAENWKWSSAWRKEYGTTKQKKILSPWPVPAPRNYLQWLNQAQTEDEEEAIRRSVTKGNPYGGSGWTDNVVKRFGLEQTLRKVGRPNTNNGG
ncbi:MAG: transposase [bacterium]|nr:transposase [bacterium]